MIGCRFLYGCLQRQEEVLAWLPAYFPTTTYCLAALCIVIVHTNMYMWYSIDAVPWPLALQWIYTYNVWNKIQGLDWWLVKWKDVQDAKIWFIVPSDLALFSKCLPKLHEVWHANHVGQIIEPFVRNACYFHQKLRSLLCIRSVSSIAHSL